MPLKFVCCVSIFCVFCLFGRTQLPTVAAAPFEYNEEHEQYPYDLETEQSKAKYDTRLLLSQQLQPEQKSSSDESIDSTEDQKSERGWHHKYNNEEKAEQHVNDNDDDDDDLQPHERAASCYTREHKYTHGQKVPRIDPCEVCLCMDGEIFCWWEKCEKRKSQIMKLNKQPEILHQKKKILRVVQTLRRPTSGGIHEKATSSNIGKYKTQQPNNNNKKPKSKLHKKQLFQQNTKPQKQQLQQQQQYHKHSKKHLTTHEEKPQQKQQDLHMSKKDFSSTQNSRRPFISKIMSFPENLPSVLYYDYHTEEHEHHKHQHHQQHLKHQMQKKLQKLQREHNWLQQTSKGLINDDNDDDDDGDGDDDVSSLLTTSTTVTPEIQAHHDDNSMNRILISSPSMRAYDDLQTDSDILPEPPTKKPKFVFAKLSNRTATMAEPRGSNLTDNDSAAHVMSTEWTSRSTAGSPHRIFVGETSATSSIFVTDDVIEINKNSNENSPKTSTHRTFSAMDIQVNNRSNNNKEAQDDAFHRWLTSTETNNDRKNNNNNNNNNKSIYNNKIYNDSLYDENLLHYFNENSYATESSEFENPFGIQNLSISIQQNVRSSTGDNKNSNKNIQDNENNRSNKHPKDQGRVKNAKNRLFPGAFNNDASDYNGSVVNIDISLTTQDEIQRQEQQQQQHWEIPKHEETEQQLPETPTSTTFAAGLILNQSDTKQTAKTINDTKMNATKMGGLTPQGDGNGNSNNNNNTETYLTKSVTTSAMTATASPSTLKTTEMSHVQLVKHTSKDDNEADAVAETTTATSTTIPERHCNVMGTLYKIGEVLPQDTGNCLQCICIDGSTIDDTPRVTCSPHNCPPLVLPDLFDATGY